MPRESLNDLSASPAVMRARSFTQTAAKLGVSPSALSHALRGGKAIERGASSWCCTDSCADHVAFRKVQR